MIIMLLFVKDGNLWCLNWRIGWNFTICWNGEGKAQIAWWSAQKCCIRMIECESLTKNILVPYLTSKLSRFRESGRVPWSLLFSRFLQIEQQFECNLPKLGQMSGTLLADPIFMLTYNRWRSFNSPKLSGTVPSKLLFCKSLHTR